MTKRLVSFFGVSINSRGISHIGFINDKNNEYTVESLSDVLSRVKFEQNQDYLNKEYPDLVFNEKVPYGIEINTDNIIEIPNIECTIESLDFFYGDGDGESVLYQDRELSVVNGIISSIPSYYIEFKGGKIKTDNYSYIRKEALTLSRKMMNEYLSYIIAEDINYCKGFFCDNIYKLKIEFNKQ